MKQMTAVSLPNFQGPCPETGMFAGFTKTYEEFQGSDDDLSLVSDSVFGFIPHVYLRDFMTKDGYKWAACFLFLVERTTFCVLLPHRKKTGQIMKADRLVAGYYQGPWEENYFPTITGALTGAIVAHNMAMR